MADIIAICGAGGKTTLLYLLEEKYRKEGKKVLVTTTTHLLIDEDTLLYDGKNLEEIRQKIRDTGCCRTGTAVFKAPEKLGPLPAEVLSQLLEEVDLCLVEADGSRHHPLKIPRYDEPVLPEKLTWYILVLGAFALGQKVGDVVFRYDRIDRQMRSLSSPAQQSPMWQEATQQEATQQEATQQEATQQEATQCAETQHTVTLDKENGRVCETSSELNQELIRQLQTQGVTAETIVTEEIIEWIAEYGYLRPLRNTHPELIPEVVYTTWETRDGERKLKYHASLATCRCMNEGTA